jgi:UDP-GlcNAc:undecaprenyl-phosphate GlcNAc-1-phosphate transferase
MIEFILIIFSFLIIYLINKYRKTIGEKTKLIDKPDKIRKFHKEPTPLLGGIMIFLSFFLINLYLIFFQELTKLSLVIFLCCTFCLTLGLVDDIKKISYKYKFLILIIIFFLFLNLDSNLQINKIYFSTFKKDFYLNYLSIPFTILCLLLLINAINLIDGINGLCILISTLFIMWSMSVFHNMESLYIVVIITLINILYLNLKKNIFLGDSGSLFLGALIGMILISNYNLVISKMQFPVEDIFLTIMLPGLDMFRVFITRLYNKKNPFLPDRTHLHHLLIKYGFNTNSILIIFFLLTSTPILINFFTNIEQIFLIIFFVSFYFILFFYLKKFYQLKK